MSRRLVIAVLASLAAHAAAGYFLLLPYSTPPGPEPIATVALVQTESPFVGGAPQPDVQAAAPEPSPPETQTDAPELPPPVETVAREEGQVSRPPVRLTPPSPPAKPTQPAGKPASPAQNFAIRLQEDSSPGLGKFIENDNITPASLDENYKNLPPVYPDEARKRGIQGTVGMTIRIGVDGKPLDIAIETSSGSAALDNAARQAVRRWHFRPENRGGRPVESQFSMDVHFQLKAGGQ